MTIINSVDEAFTFIKTKLENAEKRANDTFPSIQKLNDIKTAPIAQVGISGAFNSQGFYAGSKPPTTIEQVDKKLEEYKVMLEANIQAITEAHESNLPAIANNQLVREKVSFVMQQIGLRSTYTKSYYKTNRSNKMTHETTIAGWNSDLQRECLVSDGYEAKISQAKSAFESLKRQAETEKQRIRKELAEKEKTEKAKKSVQALARMQVKYNLTEDSDWIDVLEALDSKDKYFALARALEDQRNDWSCGFGRVQDGIDSFVVETNEDKEIYKEIHSLAYDEDLCDGRTFRDCEYNYSFLFSKVDSELMQDYATLKEYYSEY